MLDFVKVISEELQLKNIQVENTIKLLDEGGTVPFISRYRKEMTGSLDEEVIRTIQERITYLRNLEKRKEEVIKSIEEQGKLTEELKKKILSAMKLQKVEDLYLPYKKKKKTKADIAKDNGLEPLSKLFLEKDNDIEFIESEAEKYVSENVETKEAAIEGAMLIIAQGISENASYREYIRNRMLKETTVFSKVVKKNQANDENGVYQDYYEYSETIKSIVSHRILALNRGEKEKILSVSVKFEDAAKESIKKYIIKDFKNKNIYAKLYEITEDALDRLILPSVEREVRNLLTEKAEEDAIKIFKENLGNLIMQPPIYEKTILGLDPGYRTGCKVVVVNKNGFFEESDVIYLIMGAAKEKEAKQKIINFIKKYNIDIIAIGNGTASRETEQFVANILQENDFGRKIFYVIVNEAGASVYSASKLAKEEFPNLDVTERGAISIARRIQDPMAELVKIDPKSIGVGMYQHDVNQKKLGETLEETVSSVVNNVGVNVNSASWALLGYVSGMKKNVAKNIVDYRNENGNFSSRKELKKVKGLGDKMYTLAAGFIVVPESDNPLDNTIIHPESYKIAEAILKEVGSNLKEFRNDNNSAREKLKVFSLNDFIEKNEYGAETTKDIYEALLKDRRDPRDSLPQPLLRSDVMKMEDLQEGMLLEGTVRNVVNFGAFIDIGLKNDALLHISEFGDKFIKDATGELSVGEIVKVKVKSIDHTRHRVGLTRKGL